MIEDAILNRLVKRLALALAPPTTRLRPFVVDGVVAGELTQARFERMRSLSDVFVERDGALAFVPALRSPGDRSRAMDRVARALAAEGALSAWRDERYAVAASFEAPPWFLLERAAARYFGIATYAVHVNGTTTAPDGREAMWIARRSPHKAIDPGLLDNLVGGGIAAGTDVRSTLVKEAREESGLARDLALRAEPRGTIAIRRLHGDGLQRETIFVHDLSLPAEAVPRNEDGEVVAFRLASPEEVAWIAGTAEGTEASTVDAALVMAAWLLRRGHAPAGSPLARLLAARAQANAG